MKGLTVCPKRETVAWRYLDIRTHVTVMNSILAIPNFRTRRLRVRFKNLKRECEGRTYAGEQGLRREDDGRPDLSQHGDSSIESLKVWR